MKELLIVNDNMKVGGVQKSLQNLLWSLDPAEYRVTLLLFNKVGPYLELPEAVRVLEVTGPFRYFGKSQGEFSGWAACKRGLLATVSRLFGRSTAVRLMLKKQPMLEGRYDCAIAFLNNGLKKVFYGGVQDYVLHRVQADRKVVFLHSDYERSGSHYPENDRMMARFDTIAACSEGCRRAFVAAVPEQADHCVAVRNCHRYEEIRRLAALEPVAYERPGLHAVTVARMTPRKRVDRAIRAVAAAKEAGTPVMLHVVGDGPEWDNLQALTRELGVTDAVVFHGQQDNPYPYIKAADLLLLSSYHEAAPMVIEEARCLGLPVLSTEIISTKEMVTEARAGWVCENSTRALCDRLCRLAADPQELAAVTKRVEDTPMDNREALAQFAAVTQG